MNKYTAIIQHLPEKSKGFGNISAPILIKFHFSLHIREIFSLCRVILRWGGEGRDGFCLRFKISAGGNTVLLAEQLAEIERIGITHRFSHFLH